MIEDMWPKDLTTCPQCHKDLLDVKHRLSFMGRVDCPYHPLAYTAAEVKAEVEAALRRAAEHCDDEHYVHISEILALISQPSALAEFERKVRLKELQNLMDIADNIGDPYKLFGALQDEIAALRAGRKV